MCLCVCVCRRILFYVFFCSDSTGTTLTTPASSSLQNVWKCLANASEIVIGISVGFLIIFACIYMNENIHITVKSLSISNIHLRHLRMQTLDCLFWLFMSLVFSHFDSNRFIFCCCCCYFNCYAYGISTHRQAAPVSNVLLIKMVFKIHLYPSQNNRHFINKFYCTHDHTRVHAYSTAITFTRDICSCSINAPPFGKSYKFTQLKTHVTRVFFSFFRFLLLLLLHIFSYAYEKTI